MNYLKVFFLFLFSIFSAVIYADSVPNSFINKSPELLWDRKVYSFNDKIIKWANINISYKWINWTICNQFSMNYDLDIKNNLITSSDVNHTEVSCEWNLDDLEKIFFNLSWNKYEYKDDTIKIFTDFGPIILNRPGDSTTAPEEVRCILDWGIISNWYCEFEDGLKCNLADYFKGICKKSDYNNISSELISAYNWSYSKKITTMQNFYKANMNSPITRAELAKMMVWFSVNILNKEEPTEFKCKFSDISNIDPNLEITILQSCDLWIMWQWIKEFRPSDFVTRAEFWTVLSRTLRWNENEWWSTYYQNHLQALKNKWIMNDISCPMNQEIRWYVMIMLMRYYNSL